MSPLEAVARRLALLADEADWRPYLIPARAALTALRDNGVTEAMSEAASHVDGVYVGNQEFRAMLDAALTEPES